MSSMSISQVRLASLLTATTLLGATACVPPAPPIATYPSTVTTHVVANIPSVSFASTADVVGSSDSEIVVSAFGSPLTAPGTVTVYQRGADLDTWTPIPVATPADGIQYPNDSTIGDLNNDGLADIVVSGGFFSCAFSGSPCGSLQWYEQGPASTFTRHNIVTPGYERFFHRALIHDVNGDGISDLVTVGETGDSAITMWFEGTAQPGDNRFVHTPHIIGPGGGSLPVLADVDGDGDTDVVSPQYFNWGNAVVWFEKIAAPSAMHPDGVWTIHNFNQGTIGKGFEVELVPNLQGDGIARWIGTNHINQNFDTTAESGLYRFEEGLTPADPRHETLLSTGVRARPSGPQSLAPGPFGVGDVNHDGTPDVVMSGDGDDRLFVLTQDSPGVFTTYQLASAMGQAGGGEVTDLDHDGNSEALFTSYEAGVVKLYEF